MTCSRLIGRQADNVLHDVLGNKHGGVKVGLAVLMWLLASGVHVLMAVLLLCLMEGCIGRGWRDGRDQVVVVSVSGIHLMDKGASSAVRAAAAIVVRLANLGLVLI